MSQETTAPSSTQSSSEPSGQPSARPGGGRRTGSSLASTSSSLETPQGRTSIADVVVSKIAGIAARDVSGVYDLGGGTTRAVAAIRDRIPGGRTNYSQGVAVEVGEKQAAVDIDIVAHYGVSITDLAEGIRQNVISAIEQMTGLEVTEVNIVVHDVHLESDSDDDAPAEAPRVQ